MLVKVEFPVFVTVPPTKSPSEPVSFVTSNVPVLSTVPFKANFEPVPLFVIVVVTSVPLFLTIPVVLTSSCPAVFVIVRLPSLLVTLPLTTKPVVPLLLIAKLPVLLLIVPPMLNKPELFVKVAFPVLFTVPLTDNMV